MGGIGKLGPKNIACLALGCAPSTSFSKQKQNLNIYTWSVDKTSLKPAIKLFSPSQIKVSGTYDSKRSQTDSAEAKVTFSRALKLMERKVNICFLNVKKTPAREKIASYNKHLVSFYSLPELMILKSEHSQYASNVDLKDLVKKIRFRLVLFRTFRMTRT